MDRTTDHLPHRHRSQGLDPDRRQRPDPFVVPKLAVAPASPRVHLTRSREERRVPVPAGDFNGPLSFKEVHAARVKARLPAAVSELAILSVPKRQERQVPAARSSMSLIINIKHTQNISGHLRAPHFVSSSSSSDEKDIVICRSVHTFRGVRGARRLRGWQRNQTFVKTKWHCKNGLRWNSAERERMRVAGGFPGR